MMEFYIFDRNLNRIGIIDSYESATFVERYTDHGSFDLVLDDYKTYSHLLFREDPFLILTKSTDITKGYIVDVVEYEDGSELKISVSGWSLSYILNRRLIEGQQTYTGTIDYVLRQFVLANAISPTNTNRTIPNLVSGEVFQDTTEVEEVYANTALDSSLWEMCKAHEVSYRLTLDHVNKKMRFDIFRGVDRTTRQTENKRIIFSKQFDNVVFQSYVDDSSSYRNTAYIVGGDYDEKLKTVIKLNDENVGLDRREVFIQVSDIHAEYYEDGETIVMTKEVYEKALLERGRNELGEYKRVQTFDTDAHPFAQYRYGVDYFIGDVVTTRNDELGIITHSRIVEVSEKYSRDGYELNLKFGTSIPTLVDKIKRKVKN